MPRLRKRCASCKQIKSLDEFGIRTSRPDGRNPYCKLCCREVARYYDRLVQQDPVKRLTKVCRKYGITPDDFDLMMREQLERCFICFSKITEQTAKIDHNHSTGQVRGLLCHKCNMALGMLNDSLWRARRLIKYLELKDDAARAEERKIFLALLELFTMVDDVFTESDALSSEKRRMSLGRIYEQWKRSRAVMDPEFDPKEHQTPPKYGSVRVGLSHRAQR